MENYKKYLKYKQKYTDLKQTLTGGTKTIFERVKLTMTDTIVEYENLNSNINFRNTGFNKDKHPEKIVYYYLYNPNLKFTNTTRPDGKVYPNFQNQQLPESGTDVTDSPFIFRVLTETIMNKNRKNETKFKNINFGKYGVTNIYLPSTVNIKDTESKCYLVTVTLEPE